MEGAGGEEQEGEEERKYLVTEASLSSRFPSVCQHVCDVHEHTHTPVEVYSLHLSAVWMTTSS